jgi:Acetyltransferase (GNAT) domain
VFDLTDGVVRMPEIREATPSDNDALIDLELRSPLDLGDRTIVFDRSPNYFAHQEMQEHTRVMVAEDEGEIVAAVAGAWRDVMIGGERHRLLYVHQGRTLPKRRREHVATDLVIRTYLLAREEGVETPYWLISPDNSTSLAFNRQVEVEAWPVEGRIDGFDVAARRPAGSEVDTVGPNDLPRALELINETHRGREMFMPYTAESLEGRLRHSASYSLQHWRGYRSRKGLVAVAGMWDFGRSLKITERSKSGNSVHVSIPAFVLDYGYVTGAEEAMVEVFFALMGTAADAGRNELSIALPLERRLYSLMADLPHSSTLFHILTPRLKTPISLEGSVYLDPVYI